MFLFLVIFFKESKTFEVRSCLSNGIAGTKADEKLVEVLVGDGGI